MSYIISEQRVKQFNSTQNRTEYSASIICDDVASLPTNNSDYWYLLGSDAKVISNGKRYIINSSGIWVEQPNENVWENVYTKAEIDEMITEIYGIITYYHTTLVTDTGEITFYALAGYIGTWTIYGNGQQSGTQTPVFVGARTGNLHNPETDVFGYINPNGDIVSSSITKSTDFIPCESGTQYVLRVYKTGTLQSTNQRTIDFYASDKSYIDVGWDNRVKYVLNGYEEYLDIPFVVPTGAKFLRFCYDIGYSKSMLNLGSAALPYEPFGYKIPISCGGQTNNIYLSAPLRKAIDGTDAVDTLDSTGTITRNVDENGDALGTPTTETIDVPEIPTVQGENTLTVDTILKPSKIVISGESN